MEDEPTRFAGHEQRMKLGSLKPENAAHTMTLYLRQSRTEITGVTPTTLKGSGTHIEHPRCQRQNSDNQ